MGIIPMTDRMREIRSRVSHRRGDRALPDVSAPRLSIEDVSVSYSAKHRTTEALSKISLEVPPGSFTTVIGPSGCGKTTLLNVIAGFVSPTSGRVIAAGHEVRGPGADRAVVFQNTTALLPWLNVEQNIELGPRLRKVPKEVRVERVEFYVERLGLSSFRRSRLYELSGGMQQRVAVGRALANDADFVLLDEPFGALDAMTRDSMQDLILDVWNGSGRTFFLITHSIEEALYLGTSVVAMTSRPGRIADTEEGFALRASSEGQATKGERLFVERREYLRSLLNPTSLDEPAEAS
jgi:taurine transport system ATP-binding protein